MFYLCQLNELVLYRYDTDKTLIWMRCTRETTLCDKVCQWLADFLRVLACLSVTCWFSPGTCMFVSDLLVFSGYLHVCQWLAGFLRVLACLSVTCWFSPGTCWFSPGTCWFSPGTCMFAQEKFEDTKEESRSQTNGYTMIHKTLPYTEN
jgi:hypothetical protein